MCLVRLYKLDINEEREYLDVPIPEPEQASLITCLSLLVFSRVYNSRKEAWLPYESIIYVYSAFGSLFLITAIDVTCQIFREPVANTTMIIFSFLASTMCLIAGILLFLQYIFTADDEDTYRFLFILILLGSFSLFSAAVYVVDAILILKYSAVEVGNN